MYYYFDSSLALVLPVSCIDIYSYLGQRSVHIALWNCIHTSLLHERHRDLIRREPWLLIMGLSFLFYS